MRLLITGGAGFVGSNFVRYMLQSTSDVRVTNLDSLTSAGNPAFLQDIDRDTRCRFVHDKIRDAEVIDREVADLDAISHFAAESHVDWSIDGPPEFLDTNVVGAGVVFVACRRHEVERVLDISTNEVYGSIDEPNSFSEIDPLLPNSSCSASRAAADLLERSYGITKFPITVTRTANNYGPYQYLQKVISLFVTNLIDGLTVSLHGDVSNVRDWTHVHDNVAAQWLVLTQGTPGEVYNAGASNVSSNTELMCAIPQQFEVGDDMIEFVADHPGHDRRYSINTSTIRALGWQPKSTFEEGLAQAVAWYRANEGWWRPLRDAKVSDRRGVVT